MKLRTVLKMTRNGSDKNSSSEKPNTTVQNGGVASPTLESIGKFSHMLSSPTLESKDDVWKNYKLFYLKFVSNSIAIVLNYKECEIKVAKFCLLKARTALKSTLA